MTCDEQSHKALANEVQSLRAFKERIEAAWKTANQTTAKRRNFIIGQKLRRLVREALEEVGVRTWVDRPCPECGVIHPCGVVLLDDNTASLAMYAELHPKTWASIERGLDEKKGPHYWGDGHAHPELAPKEDPRRRDDQDESP